MPKAWTTPDVQGGPLDSAPEILSGKRGTRLLRGAAGQRGSASLGAGPRRRGTFGGPHPARDHPAPAAAPGRPSPARRRVPEPGPGDTGPPPSAADCGKMGVPTPVSPGPLDSRLLIPPGGPKTAGAAAPVAAAACSWRTRAATATAASSTSTVGCLGLPRRECWAPAWPPSHPPRRMPQQVQRPGPIRPDPRSQDRGRGDTSLLITEEDSA